MHIHQSIVENCVGVEIELDEKAISDFRNSACAQNGDGTDGTRDSGVFSSASLLSEASAIYDLIKEGAYQGTILADFKHTITEIMDPDFGLLEALQSLQVVTFQQYTRIKSCATFHDKNDSIIQLLVASVNDPDKYRLFLAALLTTGQRHLVNFLKGNGVVDPRHEDERPLDYKHLSIIDRNRYDLHNNIIPDESFLAKLLQDSSITNAHKEAIHAMSTDADKIGLLLDILRRRSVRALRSFIEAIRTIQHLPQLADALINTSFTPGVEIHVPFESNASDRRHYEELLAQRCKDSIINPFNFSREANECLQMLTKEVGVVLSAKQSESIAFVIEVRTLAACEALLHMQQSSKRLRELLHNWFQALGCSELLLQPGDPCIDAQQLDKARKYFQEYPEGCKETPSAELDCNLYAYVDVVHDSFGISNLVTVRIIHSPEATPWCQYLSEMFSKKLKIQTVPLIDAGLLSAAGNVINWDTKQKEANSVVIVIVSPEHIEFLLKHSSFNYHFLTANDGALIVFFCGVDVKDFENNVSGRESLTERFPSFECWTHVTHNEWERVLTTVAELIESPNQTLHGKQNEENSVYEDVPTEDMLTMRTSERCGRELQQFKLAATTEIGVPISSVPSAQVESTKRHGVIKLETSKRPKSVAVKRLEKALALAEPPPSIPARPESGYVNYPVKASNCNESDENDIYDDISDNENTLDSSARIRTLEKQEDPTNNCRFSAKSEYQEMQRNNDGVPINEHPAKRRVQTHCDQQDSVAQYRCRTAALTGNNRLCQGTTLEGSTREVTTSTSSGTQSNIAVIHPLSTSSVNSKVAGGAKVRPAVAAKKQPPLAPKPTTF